MIEELVVQIECPNCKEVFKNVVEIKKGVAGKSNYQDKCPHCDELVTIPINGVLRNNSTVLRGD